MAVGDIVQAVGWNNSGADTVGISSNYTTFGPVGGQGPDQPWATPTSGNTLVVMLSGSVTVSSFTGWTLRHSYTAGTYPRYIYTKTSDGTESTITVTLSGVEGMMIGVWEIEGEVTFDVASSGEVASGTSISSGTTATLASSSSVAIAFAHQWASNTDMAFTQSFVEDFDWGTGTYSELYYLGGAHKAITGTTGVETTASWTGTEYGTCMVAVFSIAQAETTTGELNAGGSISASVTKYLTQVARPTSTIAAGSWDTGPTTGQALHTYAGDASDTTYIEDTTV